jgi:CarD family transcriptional regulator
MYKVGDYVVKSTNGVCKIEDITHLDIPGVDKNKSYYLLIPIEDLSEKIYAPADTIEKSTRKVMSEEEARKLIDKIPEVEEDWIENDKLRQAKYKEIMKECDPESLLGIIKMVYERKWKRMSQGKKNMVVDEHYVRMAENNLYSELGFALHKDKAEISSLVTKTIRKK